MAPNKKATVRKRKHPRGEHEYRKGSVVDGPVIMDHHRLEETSGKSKTNGKEETHRIPATHDQSTKQRGDQHQSNISVPSHRAPKPKASSAEHDQHQSNGNETAHQAPALEEPPPFIDHSQAEAVGGLCTNNLGDDHQSKLPEGVAQDNEKVWENLMAKQPMSYCTICGGPFAIKALRLSVDPSTGVHFHEWAAKKRGIPPWLYRKVFFGISVRHLSENLGLDLRQPFYVSEANIPTNSYVPDNDNDLELMHQTHEHFSKFEDSRKLATEVPPVPRLPNPNLMTLLRLSDLAKFVNFTVNTTKQSGTVHVDKGKSSNTNEKEHKVEPANVRPSEGSISSLSDSEQTYGAFPMHEACREIATRYIIAAKKHGKYSLMTMKGVASWTDLYRDLGAHWSRDQAGHVLAHQYAHGYYGAAKFQGLDWEQTGGSKVSTEICSS